MKTLISNSKKTSSNKLMLYGSIVLLIYFVAFKIVRDLKLDSAVIVGVINELLTIPFLILIPVIFIMSTLRWVKDKYALKSINLLSLLIVVLTAIILTTGIIYK